jgi:hypothetical protein
VPAGRTLSGNPCHDRLEHVDVDREWLNRSGSDSFTPLIGPTAEGAHDEDQ